MVIDDEEVIRTVIKRVFEREGYEVLLASDGTKLEEFLNASSVSLILLDVGLPWVDGFELCKLFKIHDRFKNIPVVFISGKKSDEDIKKGFEAGAMDYIKKPFSVEELRETVSTILKFN